MVNLTGLASAFEPTDPEPEFIDINDDDVAVTLQENNGVALSTSPGAITRVFSAGTGNGVTGIDVKQGRR